METQTERPVKIVMKMDCGCNKSNGRDHVETGAKGAHHIQNPKILCNGTNSKMNLYHIVATLD